MEKLSEEQLQELLVLGELGFTVLDVSIVMGLDFLELKEVISNQESVAHKTYMKGVLTTDMLIRKSVVSLAQQGSQPAQELWLKYIDNVKRGLL